MAHVKLQIRGLQEFFKFKILIKHTKRGYYGKENVNFRFASTFITSVRASPRNKMVRVRFAPSPTGFLHLGGLRTALYNYLFSKSHGGQFLLRIEDTDQARLVPGAVEQLEEDLRWVGLMPDEGPTAGGSYGPYVQSERLALYQGHAQNLLESGAAYRCFCTDRRLDMIRKEATRQAQIPKYDNRCRHLTHEEIKEKIQADVPYCIRFKLVSLGSNVRDLVNGEIDYDPATHEGDPVILKQDGFPTYHLANVVDDHTMVISHVLRGVEWQVSTPKHVMLYKAFGWDAPQFAHLPLVMNPDGTKLSKRQGDIQVRSFREQGFFPRALVNFITKAGGGFKDTNLDDVYSLEDLVPKFDLNRLHTHSCRLSDRLPEYNQLELRRQLALADSRTVLQNELVKIVSEAFPEQCTSGAVALEHNHVARVLDWSQTRIHRLADLVSPELSFLWLLPSVESIHTTTLTPGLLQVIGENLAAVPAADFTKEILNPLLKKVASSQNVPFGPTMRGLRSILSGLKEGPAVAEMMETLGHETTLYRIQNALNILGDLKMSNV